MLFNLAIWVITAVATLGMIARPWNWPEFVWAIAGAMMLVVWLRYFAGSSFVAIIATYLLLRLLHRPALDAKVATLEDAPPLTSAGKLTAIGIALTVVVLLSASAFDRPLGLPTLCAGASLTAVVLVVARQSPLPTLRNVSWSVLPLVAALFVLVAGVNQTGVLAALARNLHDAAAASPQATSWIAGIVAAVGANIVNNLPAGLIAAVASHDVRVPAQVAGAILIGVDLGPNLSATGSLATILWLIALRREGENVTSLRFLRYGLFVMPPALVLSLLTLSAISP
jgi:arsenical pump membrane protein